MELDVEIFENFQLGPNYWAPKSRSIGMLVYKFARKKDR